MTPNKYATLRATITRAKRHNYQKVVIRVTLTEEILDELAKAEKRIAELEHDETQLIKERDSAEKALADMYEAAMGERPEWSNLFGYAEAIDDVVQHVNFLDLAACTAKGE